MPERQTLGPDMKGMPALTILEWPMPEPTRASMMRAFQIQDRQTPVRMRVPTQGDLAPEDLTREDLTPVPVTQTQALSLQMRVRTTRARTQV